ncbi:RDD family protein [Herbaspirillum sp. HC18]|nr:RDD family protein [Herbaspirillum sp. HC18]
MNPLATPPLKRRLASMVYEAMLMFGVLFFSGWFFSTLLQQRHALYLRGVLQDWLFLVIGAYFVWFWTHGGQTLAMKTWRIRLVTTDGDRVGFKRALGRFLLAWLWVLPGLAAAWALGVKNWLLVLVPAVNVALWALTIFLDPQRQFLHDRIAGTRLIMVDQAQAKAGA